MEQRQNETIDKLLYAIRVCNDNICVVNDKIDTLILLLTSRSNIVAPSAAETPIVN